MPKKEKTAEVAQDVSLKEKNLKGHNSKPGLNPALQQIFTDVEKLEEQRKQINKAMRECRLEAKEKHGVSIAAFSHEMRMRRLEPETRREFEHDCDNLKHMLGYQYSLELQKDVPAAEDHSDPVEVGKAEAKKTKLASIR